ncbi:MAG: hypothetical protein AB1659_12655, partial [Thermodesulfobacteriota bacterium]
MISGVDVKHTTCDISFIEKVKIFSYDYLKCCLYLINYQSTGFLFSKKLYSELISTSQLLED